MLTAVKGILKGFLGRTPGLSGLYWGRWRGYGRLDEKEWRAALQSTAHALDLAVTDGRAAPADRVHELAYLLRQAKAKGLAADAAIAWAAGILTMARLGLRPAGNVSVRPAGEPATFQMPLGEAILGRRSVRKWTADPVDPREIDRCIDMARWAPSSCNRQAWQVLLASQEEERQFLGRYFPNTFYLRAPLLVLVLAKVSAYGGDEKCFSCLDGGAFIQNFLLALHACGYGACWIGFKGWSPNGERFVPAPVYEEFYRHFGLDRGLSPISLIAVGRPAQVPPAPPRQDADAIIIGRGRTSGGAPGAVSETATP